MLSRLSLVCVQYVLTFNWYVLNNQLKNGDGLVVDWGTLSAWLLPFKYSTHCFKPHLASLRYNEKIWLCWAAGHLAKAEGGAPFSNRTIICTARSFCQGSINPFAWETQNLSHYYMCSITSLLFWADFAVGFEHGTWLMPGSQPASKSNQFSADTKYAYTGDQAGLIETHQER